MVLAADPLDDPLVMITTNTATRTAATPSPIVRRANRRDG